MSLRIVVKGGKAAEEATAENIESIQESIDMFGVFSRFTICY